MESRSYPIKQVKYSRRVNVQAREAADVVLPLDVRHCRAWERHCCTGCFTKTAFCIFLSTELTS